MNIEIYEKYIEGSRITDCDVIDKNNIVFGLKEEKIGEEDHRPPDERSTSVLLYAAKKYKDRGGFGRVRWGSGIEEIFVSYKSIDTGIIYCDTDFNSFEIKHENVDFLPVDQGKERDDLTKGVDDITYIGNDVYMVGFFRKVFKREGVHQWIDLTDEKEHSNLFSDLKELKKKYGNYANASAGFSAIDGFSADDIYAGGEAGDTWHYDGKKWQRVDIPGNFNIKTITCAGDGHVYIAGYTGGIIKGRGDIWENIDPDGGYVFSSSTWFKGKLYLAGNMNGLHVMEENKIKLYEFPKKGRVQYSFYGGVASSEDILVSYGEHQALVFDGSIWNEIIGVPVLSGDG